MKESELWPTSSNGAPDTQYNHMIAIDFVIYMILRCTEKNAADAILGRVDVAEVRLLVKEINDLTKLTVKEVRC